MPTVVNHLLNRNSQNSILEISFGRRVVTGDTCYSYSTGSGGSLNVFGYNALGEGIWEECESLYFEGLNIPDTDYDFHDGSLATGKDSGPQQTDIFFTEDVPHTRTAAIGFKGPDGIGSEDTKANPPSNLEGIYKTKKCPDFNSSGTQTDFGYTTNPARAIVELLLSYARMPFVPPIYASMAAYWLSRFDWVNWTEFRDYHDTLETVDYRTTEISGFGVTAEYFLDQTFTTLHTKRVEPSINLQMGSGSPAVGLDPDDYSGRLEGFIKAKYTEEYTFTLNITDLIAQVWVDDVSIIDKSTVSTGAFTGTANLTANTYHTIKIEFKESGSDANLDLQWSSASQLIEIIPTKNLLPKVEQKKLYELNMFFNTGVSPSVGIREILDITNSIMQDVNGKFRFFCLEQLVSEFTFNSTNIIEGTFNFRDRDILRQEPITEFEAKFRYLDYQYLEEIPSPVTVAVENLPGMPAPKIKVIDLYNTDPWQAKKVLDTKAKFETANSLLSQFESTNAKSYPAIQGSMVTVNHRKTGGEDIDFLIRTVSESSLGEGSSGIFKKKFTLQEWGN